MKNIYEYKGYFTKIEFSVEDGVLHGKIEGIKDLVNFESEDPKRIEQEFHDAVDDYLQMCEDLGESPDKSYSGTFNVRVSPALHRELAMKALKNGDTLNGTVEKALQAYIEDQTSRRVEEIWDAVSNYSGDIDNVGRANYSVDIYGASRNKLKVVGQ